jgi:hypothetical protein
MPEKQTFQAFLEISGISVFFIDIINNKQIKQISYPVYKSSHGFFLKCSLSFSISRFNLSISLIT